MSHVILHVAILIKDFPSNINKIKSFNYRNIDDIKFQECVEAAAEVLAKVDLTVDPCEDFYQFACGNYIKNSVIPDDKES